MTNAPTGRADLRLLTGEFRDRTLEQHFLSASWPRTHYQLHIVFIVGLVMTLAMVFANLFDPHMAQTGGIYLRIAQVLSMLLVLSMVKLGPLSHSLALAILLTEFVVTLVEAGDFFYLFAAEHTPPSQDMPFMILFIFVMYLIVPNRFSYTIGVTLFAGVLFTVLSFFSYEADVLLETAYMFLKFTATLAMGIGYGGYVNRLRRQEWVQRNALEQEVSQRQLAEQHALEAQDVAEKASYAKSRFLAAATHDLRQPLHAMSFFIDSLDKAFMEGTHRQVLEQTRQTRDNLNSLIESVLDISRLDAGTQETNVQSMPLQLVFDELARIGSGLSREHDTRLRIVPTRLLIHSDEMLLARMLYNLLENACKYSPGGQVLIGCRRRGDKVHIQVRDTGTGIAPEKMKDAFLEFVRLDQYEHSLNQGLGLGLAIVKRLADLLEHELRVDSEIGKGSCFTLVVKRAQPSQSDDMRSGELASPMNLQGMTIALIDNEEEILEATGALLNSWGCSALPAHSATEFEKILLDKGGEIDAIIADHRLPGDETGLALLTRLCDSLQLDCPRILLTGDLDPKLAEQAQGLSIDIMHKPLKPARLRTRLSELWSLR